MPPKRKRDGGMVSPARGRGQKKSRHNTRQQKPGTKEVRDNQPPFQHQESSESVPGSEAAPDLGEFVPANFGNIGNSDFSLDLNVADFTPVPELSYFDNVGQHIPLKLKQKIWDGQFVDLGLLLKSAKEIDYSLGGQGEIKIRDGKFCVVRSNDSSYLTIDKWTNAFMIYMSVMLEKYRARAQEFLKYMRDIRLAATRSQGWYKYDEQYRLRKASNPESSWGIISQEFWLLYVTGQSSFHSQTQFSNNKQFSSQSSTSAVTQYCYHFNQGKKCNFFPKCRFKHICRRCGGKHPANNCSSNSAV
ncbi:uncharacterized protein LOC130054574 [Ostrea edulis]|uniref:uncharacterized protein LOC130054574 n=1 Tax=Ostrea edulis TaxID=37623 RepID=UPI0024AF3B1A|nr:uncharacterized protein LOC130054574 [Ostrea edulis]